MIFQRPNITSTVKQGCSYIHIDGIKRHYDLESGATIGKKTVMYEKKLKSVAEIG